VRQQLHLGENGHGVVVSRVDPSGAAANSGIREGDVIQEVNHQQVGNVSEFEQAMRDAGNQAILLRIQRDGTGLYVAIAPR
jgi:serine protease Do